MGRSPCCSKEAGLNRGSWTALEDKILTDYIKIHGEGRWRNLPQRAGLKRCGKSCRLRWLNYLRPDIKRGNITQDEEELIIRLHKLLGNRWSLIAGRLPGRTDNEIKNYWNTYLGKKFLNQRPNGTKNELGVNIIPCNASNNSENNYPTVSASDPPSQAHVVRTRAVKCTEVLLSNDDVLGKSGNCNSAGPVCDNEPAGLGPDGNVVNTVPAAASDPAANSIYDAEDELFLADFFMGSEFPRGEDYFRDVSCYVKDDLDHDLRLPEELTVSDWTASGSSNDVGVGVGPSFCFNSFLGSEADWLAAD